MNGVVQVVSSAFEQLLGRASGPLHFRLFIMPTVVTVIAIRAGLRDAREGRSMYVWSIFAKPNERAALLRSGRKDIGKVLVMALMLDTTYQIIVFRNFYLIQALIVAFMCAIVPYVAFRGSIERLVFLLKKERGGKNAAVDSRA
jgi:hypothetical protein